MSKFLLASFCIALFSFATNAQVINKGQKIIGGSITASLNKYDFNNHPVTKNNYANLTATYGKAIKNNTVICVSVNYQSQKNLYTNNTVSKNNYANSIGGGIFIERFFPLTKGFSFSTNAAINGGHNFLKEEEFLKDSLVSKTVRKGNFGSINFTPSLNYQFTKRFIGQLNMNNLLSYSFSKGTHTYDQSTGNHEEAKYTSQSFYTSINNGIRLSEISVGFLYLLN